MSHRNTVLLFLDMKNAVMRLNDVDAGQLFKCVLEYSESGQFDEHRYSEPALLIFEIIRQQIDRTNTQYDKICNKNTSNANMKKFMSIRNSTGYALKKYADIYQFIDSYNEVCSHTFGAVDISKSDDKTIELCLDAINYLNQNNIHYNTYFTICIEDKFLNGEKSSQFQHATFQYIIQRQRIEQILTINFNRVDKITANHKIESDPIIQQITTEFTTNIDTKFLFDSITIARDNHVNDKTIYNFFAASHGCYDSTLALFNENIAVLSNESLAKYIINNINALYKTDYDILKKCVMFFDNDEVMDSAKRILDENLNCHNAVKYLNSFLESSNVSRP